MTKFLRDVAQFAVAAHAGQDRAKDSPLPYVSHCFDVMKRLSTWGVIHEPLLAAALLHDTVEDTEATRDDLERQFGPDVAWYVDFVTWPPDVSGKRAKFDHLVKKAASWPGIAAPDHDRQMFAGGVLLKLADRVCNVRDFHTAQICGYRNDDYASKYALLAWPILQAAFVLPEQDRGALSSMYQEDVRWIGALIRAAYPELALEKLFDAELLPQVRAALFSKKDKP